MERLDDICRRVLEGLRRQMDDEGKSREGANPLPASDARGGVARGKGTATEASRYHRPMVVKRGRRPAVGRWE